MPSPYDQSDGSQAGQSSQLVGAGLVGPPVASWQKRPGERGVGEQNLDWLRGALNWLKTGRTSGEPPPADVVKGAGAHLDAMSRAAGGTQGGGVGMGAASSSAAPRPSSPAGADPTARQLNFSDSNYPMGVGRGVNDVNGPVARGEGQSSRSAATGGGRGNASRPSSPGKTNGPMPVSFVPGSANDRPSPGAAKPEPDDVRQDPAVQSLSALLKKYTDGGDSRVDLSPLAALSDSWSNGHLLQGYDRPLTEQEKAKLQASLAENLARRQSDLEWHKARMAQYGSMNDARRDVATIQAGGRVDAATVGANARVQAAGMHPGGGRGGVGKPPPTPDQLGKQAWGQNSGIIKNTVLGNYTDTMGGKATQGAAQEAHQFIHQAALKYMQGQPQKYPDYNSAYRQALEDFPHYRVPLKGMKYRENSGPAGGGEEAGGGGD